MAADVFIKAIIQIYYICFIQLYKTRVETIKEHLKIKPILTARLSVSYARGKVHKQRDIDYFTNQNRMIHRIISPYALKKKLSVFLIFLLMLLASIAVKAQPGDAIDSLITIKKEFRKNEIIKFTVKLDKRSKKKPNHLRQVETMSCACSDKDFYYEIYSIANEKYPSSKTSFFIHNEKPDANKCACKTQYAEFYNNKKYFVPALSKAGKYILIIRGYGFIMYSNVFIVTD